MILQKLSSKWVILFYNMGTMENYVGQFNTVRDIWLKSHVLRFIENSGL